ncbi:Asp23/Gls24 family envelope stress response protein [Oerskovia douganii]|uniref:hypothetical protein n=1 Tax=Oerskovia douganii TaxID=2762210 RepID=UPI001D12FF12|nr:hypothetical protein [Oerskovia douganii]
MPGGPVAPPSGGPAPAQGAAPGAGPHPRGDGDGDSDSDLADRVVARVLAVPGVVRLHPGVLGEVATYLPGRAVPGVRLRPDGTEVHVVVSTARPIPPVARDVHEAVRPLVRQPVRVYVEDLESPPHRRPSAERAQS